MPQLVPLALHAPHLPGITNLGFLARSASSYSTIITPWSAVSESGTGTGYYPVPSGFSAPDTGCLIEFRKTSNTGELIAVVAVEPIPTQLDRQISSREPRYGWPA